MPGAPAMRAALLGGVFSPASLFAMGEQGAWYDPSDLSTMFQDTAGTIPVTTPGQTVALILDKSGRGNHATQATAASRPVYQVDGSGKPYLSFDGVDDGMVTAIIDPAADKAQGFVGLYKLQDTIRGSVLEWGPAPSTGRISMEAPTPQVGSARYFVLSGGSILISAQTSLSEFDAPRKDVLGLVADIARPIVSLRLAGRVISNVVSNQGTGAYEPRPRYIGRRSGTSLPFSGRIYGIILRFGSNLSPYQIRAAENYMNQKTGAW